MGLYEARGNINKNLSDLVLRWQSTRSDWSDEVADRFEELYIEPLEMAVRTAVSSLDQAAQVLARVDRDCK
ncbi:MAG: hypothetical protein H7144_14325 [Burkholderiales bacterium]|nr:hypothetical protein [Phycisphaerae bacterium]